MNCVSARETDKRSACSMAFPRNSELRRDFDLSRHDNATASAVGPSVEPRFGHEFRRISIHADLGQPGSVAGPDAGLPQEAGTPDVADTPTASVAGYTRPFTAQFLIASLSGPTCKVPKGQNGASKLTRWRVFDANGRPVNAPLVVTERFTPLDDPYGAFDKLKPNQFAMSDSYFGDCYAFYMPGEIPSDFRLKVEQNHLIDGEVISKNQITYLPSDIAICVHRRQGAEFGKSCKRF